ncbi:FtsX-like permease family protein [Kitasatospora sp. NPDC086791]|uniref:ABC transporter permease n=1 Tax=Kitasatospora sp. NPDC086791 TaxID=3155178 RepID=UPI00344A1642
MLGFVVRRLRGRLPLAAAVLLTVLVTTAVLTALVTFNSGVGQAGLRQALQGPGHARTTVVVTAEHGLDQRTKDEEALGAYRRKLFGDLPVRTDSMLRSRSYGLPAGGAAGATDAAGATNTAGATDTPGATNAAGVTSGAKADLTVLADVDRNRVRLVAGAWPGAAAGPVRSAAPEAAVPQSMLVRLGLAEQALPAEVRLTDRFDGKPLTVRVTGAYRAVDPFDLYWRIDPVGGHEVEVGGFTTFGPMMVDQSAFTAGGLLQSSRGWLLDADFAGVDQDTAQAVGGRARTLADDLRKTASLSVKTELPDVMSELADSMMVARSTLLIGALQLAVLAGAALLLVVRLISSRQERENELLAARGASGVRLGSFTALELVLLAAPAALFAPLLTPFLVHVLAGLGRAHQVALDTGIGWSLWPIAVLCAVACIVLATVPSVLRGAGAALRRRTGGRRQAVVSGIARNGGDLVLLALAALAYQQLSQYGGGLSTDSAGKLGVDLLLVATPTLALCAGTLVVLRLLPLAARLGARVAAGGRGLGPAMVGWQLARQPARATGPVLLLVLAVATGVLALGQQATWTASQRDQAAFSTLGGLRVSASHSSLMGQAGRFGALPGGDRLVPVVREEQQLPSGTGQVLAVDATAFADRVPVRGDLLGGRTPDELFRPLARPASAGAQNGAANGAANGAQDGAQIGTQDGVPVPGRPLRIDADVLTDPSGFPADDRTLRVTLLLRDRFGIVYKAPLTGLPADGVRRGSAPLSALVDAPLGSVAAPLTVIGATAAANGKADRPAVVRRLAVSDTADGPATAVPVPSGVSWAVSPPPGANGTDPQPGGAQSGSAPTVPSGAPAVVPGVATRDYLKATGSSVGDTVRVPFGGAVLPVKVTAAVTALPVVGRTAVLIDLPTAARALLAQGSTVSGAAEWWLPATGPDDRTPAEAAAVVRSGPGSQEVRLYDEVADGLLDDPVGAAPQSALTAIAVVTALLAAIGFGAAVAGSARQRAQDSALLLALGAPRRLVSRTGTAEPALLVALGGAVGLALGALLVHLIVPFVVLTSAARRPVPEALVELPVGRSLLLTAAIAVIPLLSAFLVGRRRKNVAARLRLVEEM